MPRVPTLNRMVLPEQQNIPAFQPQLNENNFVASALTQPLQVATTISERYDKLKVDQEVARTINEVNRLKFEALQQTGENVLNDEYISNFQNNVKNIAYQTSLNISNPTQRRLYQEALTKSNIGVDAETSLIAHQRQQFLRVEDDIFNASIDTFLNAALSSYDNIEGINNAIAMGFKAYDERAASRGIPELVNADAKQKFALSSLSPIVDQMITNEESPEIIQTVIDSFAPYLSDVGRYSLSNKLDKYGANVTAISIADGFFANIGQQGYSTAIQGSSAFDYIIQQESNGRQFDSKGNPLTSSQNAVGIAQIIEPTAKATAARLGIAWDRNRWQNDANYNRTLGEGYYNFLLQRYNNNESMAALGYHNGEGQADKVYRDLNNSGLPLTPENIASAARKRGYKKGAKYVEDINRRAAKDNSTVASRAHAVDYSEITPNQISEYAESMSNGSQSRKALIEANIGQRLAREIQTQRIQQAQIIRDNDIARYTGQALPDSSNPLLTESSQFMEQQKNDKTLENRAKQFNAEREAEKLARWNQRGLDVLFTRNPSALLTMLNDPLFIDSIPEDKKQFIVDKLTNLQFDNTNILDRTKSLIFTSEESNVMKRVYQNAYGDKNPPTQEFMQAYSLAKTAQVNQLNRDLTIQESEQLMIGLLQDITTVDRPFFLPNVSAKAWQLFIDPDQWNYDKKNLIIPAGEERERIIESLTRTLRATPSDELVNYIYTSQMLDAGVNPKDSTVQAVSTFNTAELNRLNSILSGQQYTGTAKTFVPGGDIRNSNTLNGGTVGGRQVHPRQKRSDTVPSFTWVN